MRNFRVVTIELGTELNYMYHNLWWIFFLYFSWLISMLSAIDTISEDKTTVSEMYTRKSTSSILILLEKQFM
jgi:hypothetical protein